MKIWTDKNYPIIISCAKELSRWTAKEVRELGYEPIEVTENTVVIRGCMRDVMKLNLLLRTAHRVLVPLLRGECRTKSNDIFTDGVRKERHLGTLVQNVLQLNGIIRRKS